MKAEEISGTSSIHGGDEECIHFNWKPTLWALLGKPEHRWENDIKMNFKEIRCAGVD
jgi:hypothetical protein